MQKEDRVTRSGNLSPCVRAVLRRLPAIRPLMLRKNTLTRVIDRNAVYHTKEFLFLLVWERGWGLITRVRALLRSISTRIAGSRRRTALTQGLRFPDRVTLSFFHKHE